MAVLQVQSKLTIFVLKIPKKITSMKQTARKTCKKIMLTAAIFAFGTGAAFADEKKGCSNSKKSETTISVNENRPKLPSGRKHRKAFTNKEEASQNSTRPSRPAGRNHRSEKAELMASANHNSEVKRPNGKSHRPRAEYRQSSSDSTSAYSQARPHVPGRSKRYAK